MLSPRPLPPPSATKLTRSRSAVSLDKKAGQHTSPERSQRNSTRRYLEEFTEIRELGAGDFGKVVLSKNRLDGRLYAVKQIKFCFRPKAIFMSTADNLREAVLHEVGMLSQLDQDSRLRVT